MDEKRKLEEKLEQADDGWASACGGRDMRTIGLGFRGLGFRV